MDTNSLIELIKDVNKIILSTKNRPKDMKRKPGGLVTIPENLSPIIVGDLHGAWENLKAIVHHEDNLENLKNNKSILIITGDAEHNDQTYQMKEMESSLKSLEYVFKLIKQFPNNVIYIKGNHDTFDERLRKSGISQGLEFKKYLLEETNQKFVNEVERFFDILPLFIIGNGYVITHGGPVRGGINRKQLINVRYDMNMYMQLLWNRIQEFRGGNPSLKEYAEEDIKEMLEKLKLPLDTHFIVGHNPLWNCGDRSGVWINALGVKNHHIIYSNLQTKAPYLVFENNEIKRKFAVTSNTEAYYVR